MLKGMVALQISEAELARDVHAVLEKVRQGAEVVIERNSQLIAVIKAPSRPGRPIDECIALAKAYEEMLGFAPIPDAGFGKDVQAAIDARQEPLNPASWD